ncbi:MAG: MscS Mechanosensitive ion channel [Rickettsiales bacterium]|nr:MscS Mechanosensitive ion channel [Rickettsiales bacterium]
MQAVVDHFSFLKVTLGGVALWIWLVLPLSFIAVYALVRLVVGVFYIFLCKISGREFFLKHYIFEVRHPLTLFITAVLFNGIEAMLPLGSVHVALDDLKIFLYAVAISWFLMVVISRLTVNLQTYWIKEKNVSAAALIPLFRKMATTTIVIISLLFVLQNWGFDIASMLAALGIGGIAIALASQKSVENLFGGIMLSLDQPIRVDEFGKFGELMGMVIDIGMRSTRIRTVQNTEISIPNSQLASMVIENFSARQQILFTKKLNLVYETGGEALQEIRTHIETLLRSHEHIVGGSVRVRLIDFSDNAQVIEVWAYVNTGDWNLFLELQEMFLIKMKNIVIDAGSALACPARILYFQKVPLMENTIEALCHTEENSTL